MGNTMGNAIYLRMFPMLPLLPSIPLDTLKIKKKKYKYYIGTKGYKRQRGRARNVQNTRSTCGNDAVALVAPMSNAQQQRNAKIGLRAVDESSGRVRIGATATQRTVPSGAAA
jgi:hypothetical protein